MLQKELTTKKKAVGIKQTGKAIRDQRAVRVYLACNADPAVIDPLREQAAAASVPVCDSYTMEQLGQAAGIAVGAAAVALL